MIVYLLFIRIDMRSLCLADRYCRYLNLSSLFHSFRRSIFIFFRVSCLSIKQYKRLGGNVLLKLYHRFVAWLLVVDILTDDLLRRMLGLASVFWFAKLPNYQLLDAKMSILDLSSESTLLNLSCKISLGSIVLYLQTSCEPSGTSFIFI